MKKFFLFLLIPIFSVAQSEYENRQKLGKMLDGKMTDTPEVIYDVHVEQDDLEIDVNYELAVFHDEFLEAMWPSAVQESAQDFVYKMFEQLKQTEVINNLSKFKFSSVKYRFTYTTADFKKEHLCYAISVRDLSRVVINYNRPDLGKVLISCQY